MNNGIKQAREYLVQARIERMIAESLRVDAYAVGATHAKAVLPVDRQVRGNYVVAR